MILVSDDSKGPGGGRYSPLWEQALSCDQSPRRGIPSPYLAAATGDEDARKAREIVAASMTRDQIAEAQARAREWANR